jgi:membrane-bound lytic murein transglycosylase B
MSERLNTLFSRRACLPLFAGGLLAWSRSAPAQGSASFDQWVAAFHARAQTRGISDATYTRVMTSIKPDTSVFALVRDQPEFNEELWQYLSRRVSDYRITTGKEKMKEYAALLARVEKDYGVDRSWPGFGESNRPTGIPMSRKITCAPSFRRSPLWHGGSRGGNPTGNRSCSTRW